MDEIEQCPSCGQPFTITELLGHAESCSASSDAPGGGGGGAGSANLKPERAAELVDVDLDTSSILTDGGIQLVMDGSKPDFIDLQVLEVEELQAGGGGQGKVRLSDGTHSVRAVLSLDSITCPNGAQDASDIRPLTVLRVMKLFVKRSTPLAGSSIVVLLAEVLSSPTLRHHVGAPLDYDLAQREGLVKAAITELYVAPIPNA